MVGKPSQVGQPWSGRLIKNRQPVMCTALSNNDYLYTCQAGTVRFGGPGLGPDGGNQDHWPVQASGKRIHNDEVLPKFRPGVLAHRLQVLRTQC